MTSGPLGEPIAQVGERRRFALDDDGKGRPIRCPIDDVAVLSKAAVSVDVAERQQGKAHATREGVLDGRGQLQIDGAEVLDDGVDLADEGTMATQSSGTVKA